MALFSPKKTILLGSAIFALSLSACGSDGGNSSSSEETGKATCIENAFDRNKTISAILDECSVSANDILEADIEGIDLGSCSRADVVTNSGNTILELAAACGELNPGSSSSVSDNSGNVCYYPETEHTRKRNNALKVITPLVREPAVNFWRDVRQQVIFLQVRAQNRNPVQA